MLKYCAVRLKGTISPLIAGSVIVFLLSAFSLGQYGFRGTLTLDDAIYLYGGQQMVQGTPPYQSAFDHKGPMTTILAATGISVAHLLNFDEILTVRVLFFAMGVLSSVGIFWLSALLFEAPQVGFLSAATFTTFWGFGSSAASGPQAKTAMVLFMILALGLTINKKWFWAAFFGALAGLTWQPTFIFPILTIFLAGVQTPKGVERVKNVLKAVVGASVPVLAICTYFISERAFASFWDGLILFNVKYLDQSNIVILDNIRRFRWAVQLKGFQTAGIPILMGFAALIIVFIWRYKLTKNSFRAWLQRDRFVVIFLSFPIPFVWSLLEFQGYPDFYIFLPYAALGFGWFVYQAISSIAGMLSLNPAAARSLLVLLISAVLVGAATSHYRLTRNSELLAQRQWAHQVATAYGPQARILSINVPEALVILNKSNPTPYVFIMRSIGDYTEATEPGGFEGWLARVESVDPTVIFFRPVGEKYDAQIAKWLEVH